MPRSPYCAAVLILVLSAPNLNAAPSISSIAGTPTNGQIITISGLTFGSKPTPAPLISSYDDANPASNFHTGSIGGGWYTRSTTEIASSTSYRRSPLYQNDRYVNCPFQSGDYSQLKWDAPNANDTYYYISGWFYVTASAFTCAGSGGNTKTICWYQHDGETSTRHSELYDSGTSVGGPATSYRGTMTNAPYEDWTNFLSWIPYQKWYHLEWWTYCGTSDASNGFLRTNINGRAARNWTGLDLVTSSAPHNVNFLRFGNVSGDNLSGGSILCDQLYIDNTQAHVFLSNQSQLNGWLTNSSFAHNEVQVCSSWSNTSIQFTLNQGTFSNGDTVYLYVVDASGNTSSAYPLTIGGSTTTSTTVPTTTTTTSPPTTTTTHPTTTTTLPSTTTTTTTHPSTSTTTVPSTTTTTIRPTTTTTTSTTSTSTTTTTLPVNLTMSWSSAQQAGNDNWVDSGVSWCVRLLISGSSVTTSGSQLILGFKGKVSDGDTYQIKKVSIAQRDTAGSEGAAINSTWTKVTFDGHSSGTWSTDVATIPPASEKLSDPIPFSLQAGKDYYVTFQLVSPSVFLATPSGYREFYFSGADHTDDIDWVGNGYSTYDQRIHAISSIYVPPSGDVPPAPPSGLNILQP